MEKIQLSMHCETSGGVVTKKSTLVNIRTETVIEAVNLYQELLDNLDKGTVESEHDKLPQISSANPSWVPMKTETITVAERCPRPQCGAVLQLRTSKKGVNAGTKFLACSAYFSSKSCPFTRPA